MNSTRYLAMRQFLDREGHLRVPADHIEIFEGENVPLGKAIAALRSEYRKGDLDEGTAAAYEALGFQWSPRGPRREVIRNAEIVALRGQGVSLAAIGEKYDLSRQRIHQILKANS